MDKEQKGHVTLEEILSEEREFTPEQAEARARRTMKIYKILVIVVSSLVVLLLLSGLIFGK